MTNPMKKMRGLWDKEQIRVLVLLSLVMQIILIVFAPLRKRSGNKLLLFSLWTVYLGADYVATLALSSILTHTMASADMYLTKQNLSAFWAPFLLLHLGGPDNITSYSIQDNELWWRHLLSFVVQVSVAIMVLVQSNLQNASLWGPMVLVFYAGTVKFGERIFALRAATTEQIRQSLQNVDWISRLPFPLENATGNDGFLGGCYASFEELMPSLFGTVGTFPEGPRDRGDRVFEVIGIQLCFFHDILHTKARLVHCSKGHFHRVVSFVLILVPLCRFHVYDKWGEDSLDVIITYILLSMALLLEINSLLSIVNNWMFILGGRFRILARYIGRAKKLVCCYGNKWRLVGYTGRYNLIENTFETEDSRPFRRMLIIGRVLILERLFLFKEDLRTEVLDILEKMMIEHVRNLVEGINDHRDLAQKLRSSWMARTLLWDDLGESKNLMRGKSFEECVIAWHLATEFCFFGSKNRDTEQYRMKEAIYRLSEYTMHLLLKQPLMMPPGIAKERLSDTMVHISRMGWHEERTIVDSVEKLSESLFRVPSQSWMGHEHPLSVYPLFWQLWMDLKKIGESNIQTQCDIIRDAWMEMVTFAALRCSSTEYAKTLSRGGELLTHYWLLLLNYRIYEDFRYGPAPQQPTQPQNQSGLSADPTTVGRLPTTTNSPLTPQITNPTADSLPSIEIQIIPSQPITLSLHPQSETTRFGAGHVAHHSSAPNSSTANAIRSRSSRRRFSF